MIDEAYHELYPLIVNDIIKYSNIPQIGPVEMGGISETRISETRIKQILRLLFDNGFLNLEDINHENFGINGLFNFYGGGKHYWSPEDVSTFIGQERLGFKPVADFLCGLIKQTPQSYIKALSQDLKNEYRDILTMAIHHKRTLLDETSTTDIIILKRRQEELKRLQNEYEILFNK
jgi:hypothetical protein